MEYGKRYCPKKRWDNPGIVPLWLLARTEVSPGAKLCFGRLVTYLGGNTIAWPKQETLAEQLGVKTRQVREYLRELETHHLIETTRGGRGNPAKISLISHPWEDGAECLCLACDAYDRQDSTSKDSRQDSAGHNQFNRQDSATQQNYDRQDSTGSDRQDSATNSKDEPYQGNPIKGEVNNHGAAFTPPTPTALQEIDRGMIAGVRLTELSAGPATQRQGGLQVTDQCGAPPPPPGETHSPKSPMPKPGPKQTRPLKPEPVEPKPSLRRQINDALFDYFGADTPDWATEKVLRTVEGWRERGVLVGVEQVKEASRRALAWWAEHRDSPRPRGLDPWLAELPRVVEEFRGPRPTPAPPRDDYWRPPTGPPRSVPPPRGPIVPPRPHTQRAAVAEVAR